MDSFRKASAEKSISLLSPLERLNANGGSSVGDAVAASSAISPPNSSLVLTTRPPRQAVSLLTCSKLCAICFVAGVVFGYTLKRRVRRWASKLLKHLKE